jgi:hypothetical protein
MPIHPTPPQLFEAFEAGEMTREQLHAALAWHATDLLDEIQQTHDDPQLSWWETMLAKRAATRLTDRHGPGRVRLVLAALADIPDFTPARYLWNALHPDVPIHVFFRIRLRPRFRLLDIAHRHDALQAEVEYENDDLQTLRETYRLEHQAGGLRADPQPLK